MRNWITGIIAALTLAACGGGPANTPPPTLTLVPSSTPRTGSALFDTLPASVSEEGYPQLGDPAALVEVREYGSYGSGASRAAYDEIVAGLLPRIAAGEIRYVYVPLTGIGGIENSQGAARGALCALEQGAFWPYHDRLFALQFAVRDNGYTGNDLLNLVDELALDRDAWNNCVLGTSIDPVLTAAAEEAAALESFSGTPTILVNGNYVLNDLFSMNTIIDQILVRMQETGGTPAALPTFTPDAALTPDAQFDAVVGQGIEPPIDMPLPQGWQPVLTDTYLLNDIDAVRTVPFTWYRGPVTGGTGNIVLLWGFPNTVAGSPMEVQMGIATPQPNLWTDGLRLLRLALVEVGCNVGTDVERRYTVAGVQGVGTEWSAVDCPQTADTRGWFVGVQQYGLNFVFFTYIEPIDPAQITPEEQIARREIQAILDGVTFRPIDATPTP